MFTFNIKNNEKVLIIAPHPDDECIGVGGLMLLYPQNCDVWLMTDGSQGKIEGYTKKNISEIRKKEFTKEMEIIGVNNYRMFDIEDGTLSESLDILLHENLSIYTKIFVPNREDRHADHRASYNAVKKAIKYQKLKETEIYQYEISSPLPRITHMLELSNIQNKTDLISIHKTQTDQYDYCGYAYYLNAYRAATNNLRGSFVEAYLLENIYEENENSKEEFLETVQQKQAHMIKVYDKWLDMELRDISISVKLEDKCRTVAIYGFGMLGKRLYQSLQRNTNIQVEYIIDKMAGNMKSVDGNIVMPSNTMKQVDLIIVTAIHEFKEIKKELVILGYSNVISLEDLLDL